jgi:hypothetical protein
MRTCEHSIGEKVREKGIADQHCIHFQRLYQCLNSIVEQIVEDGEYLAVIQTSLTSPVHLADVKIRKFDLEGKEQRQPSTP